MARNPAEPSMPRTISRLSSPVARWCMALNVVPVQADHRKATQPALEMYWFSTKTRNNRPISDSARFVDASNWNVAPQLAPIETQR
jgi:hypothetical protein